MCNSCGHGWLARSCKKVDYQRHYHDYLFGRNTLKNIADSLQISVPTLRKNFDNIVVDFSPKPPPPGAVNLVLDVTFFGREYGYFCFHDTHEIVYALEVKTECLADLHACLDQLVLAGYRFKSFTLDGKRGFACALQKRFPDVPIQMCVFHQKMIIRRYITNNPKSRCGQDLKALMAGFLKGTPEGFSAKFKDLQRRHKDFLGEKNKAGKFKHKRLRSAVRSLRTNSPLLFTYKLHPELEIPHTSNHIEGAFSHLKERIRMHRGMSIKRKKKAILFLLKCPK